MVPTKSIGSESSYSTTLLFWLASDATINVVSKVLGNISNFEINNEYRLLMKDKNFYSSSIINRNSVVNPSALQLSLHSRIRHALSQACTSPQELFSEISRLKNGRTRRHLDNSSSSSNQIINQSNNIVLDTLSFAESFKMRCVFVGLFCLLNTGWGESSLEKTSYSLSLSRKDDWMCSIAEALFLSLSNKNLSTLNSNEDNSFMLLKMSPMLAELLYHVAHEFEDKPKLDWIFFELAKRLSEFIENLRQLKRISKVRSNSYYNSQPQSTRSLLSMDSFMEPGGYDGNDNIDLSNSFTSVNSGIPSSILNNNFSKSSNNINNSKINNGLMTLSFNNNKSRLSSSSPFIFASCFAVGDSIDGLSITKNGSQRWFPGKIKTLNGNGTFGVIYVDGDEDPNKKESELRPTKQRKQQKKSNSNINSINFTKENNPNDQQEDNNSSNVIIPTLPLSNVTEKIQEKPLELNNTIPVDISSVRVPPISSSISPRFVNRPKVIRSPDFTSSPSGRNELLLGSSFISVLSARSDCSNASEDSGNHVFEIPSVFANGPRLERVFQPSEDIVPKMQFSNLNIASSAPHSASAQSLSSCILQESSRDNDVDIGSMATSSRSLVPANSYRSKDELASSNTRLLSWREESSRTGRSTSRLGGNLPRPNGPPNDPNLIASQEMMLRSKGLNSVRSGIESARPLAVELMDDITLAIHMRTYSIIISLLMSRCITGKYFLDYNCCSLKTLYDNSSSTPVHSSQFPNQLQKQHQVNILFHLREFIESIPPSIVNSTIMILSTLPSMTSKAEASNRLLKLLTAGMFRNCLGSHIEQSECIGTGGFGNISKVTCSCNRNSYNGDHICTFIKNGFNLCDNKKLITKNRSYAIKRIPRERSMHDNPMIYEIFQEVSSLEALKGNIGICKLFDYGIYGSEFWLVMECGQSNLKEWREQRQSLNSTENKFLTNSNNCNSKSKSSCCLSKSGLMECLVIFLDILLIVKSVHDSNVVHFDIKCDNFILRHKDQSDLSMKDNESIDHSLDIHAMRAKQEQGRPSGVIFLADFGESVPYNNIDSPKNSSSGPVRCRGTLSIQSPEMICISEGEKKKTTNLNCVSFPSPDKCSDIWSLGCLFAELLTSSYLFENRPWPDLFVTLCMKEFPSLPLDKLREKISFIYDSNSNNRIDNVISHIVNIITVLMKQHPKDRSNISEVIVLVNKLIVSISLEGNENIEEGYISVCNELEESINIPSSMSHSTLASYAEDMHNFSSCVIDCTASYDINEQVFLLLGSKLYSNSNNDNDNDNNEKSIIENHDSKSSSSQNLNAEMFLVMNCVDNVIGKSSLSRVLNKKSSLLFNKSIDSSLSTYHIIISLNDIKESTASTSYLSVGTDPDLLKARFKTILEKSINLIRKGGNIIVTLFESDWERNITTSVHQNLPLTGFKSNDDSLHDYSALTISVAVCFVDCLVASISNSKEASSTHSITSLLPWLLSVSNLDVLLFLTT
jgi:serine/threonine protein kinase